MRVTFLPYSQRFVARTTTAAMNVTKRWLTSLPPGKAVDVRAQPQPPQLPVEVGPRPPLPAALADRVAQRHQCALDGRAIRVPPARVALLAPGHGRGVTTRPVAARAGGELVLRPRRAALEPRDQMIDGGVTVAESQWPAAPHALQSVAFEDAPEALGARKVGRDA
jgi:hypothetical protein